MTLVRCNDGQDIPLVPGTRFGCFAQDGSKFEPTITSSAGDFEVHSMYFGAALLRVVQTRVALGGSKTVVTGEPKTASGKRTVPRDAVTLDSLRRLRLLQARERLAAAASYDDAGLIAVDELGRPIRPDALGHRFARIAVAAGLPRIRLHDLRHTAASLMHESGVVPLRTLAAMLGHADARFHAAHLRAQLRRGDGYGFGCAR